MPQKCAITLEYCQEIGGSNAFLLDIANALKTEYGFDVHFHVFQLSDIVRSRIESAGHKAIDLLKCDPFQLQGDYDLVWGPHWPVLGIFLLAGKIRFRNLILHSMSPFVDFERIIFFTNESGLILYNSEENMKLGRNYESSTMHKDYLFPNSLPSSFFVNETHAAIPRYDFSYVSNHYTPEIIKALDILEDEGYRVRKTGRHFGQKPVNTDYIDDTRVIISIGHTILKTIARKRHAFIYDRFGGPGYLTAENFDAAAERNFSGRYAGYRTAEEIAQELLRNMPDRANADTLHVRAKKAFQLQRNLAEVVERLETSRPWRQLDPQKERTAFILSYSYYARRAGLTNAMPDTWFVPALEVEHEHRSVEVVLQMPEVWKCLEVKAPPFFRLADAVRSFQVTVYVLNEPKKAAISSVFAQRDDGETFDARSGIPSPHVAQKFPGDTGARRCGHQLILPLRTDNRGVEIRARDVEGKEHALARIILHPADVPESKMDQAQDS